LRHGSGNSGAFDFFPFLFGFLGFLLATNFALTQRKKEET
jgi:hypothetical protein